MSFLEICLSDWPMSIANNSVLSDYFGSGQLRTNEWPPPIRLPLPAPYSRRKFEKELP